MPKNMSGTVLYPLNRLKEIEPEVYNLHVKKYEGREKLLTTEIPPLKCLWNDVLHFTAVSPQELKENLEKADLHYDPMAWFKVPIEMVVGDKSIVFTYRRDQNTIPNFKIYEKFNPSRMAVYRAVPTETIEYYKEKKLEATRPLLFHLVPHILYKGIIDVKDLEIITV